MMKNEIKVSIEEEEKEEKLRKKIIISKNRIKAIDFIRDIYCIVCEHEEDCSARYPDHIYKCPYLVDWALEKYKEHLGNNE